MIAVWNGYVDRFTMLKQAVPVVVGGSVFVLIGLYMMKSGVKKILRHTQVFGGAKMKREIAIVVVASLLIVGTVFGLYLWKASAIPKLSCEVVRIPMNELQDEEGFHVVDEVGRSYLIFGQRLETYCGAEDLLKIEMDIQGNAITITETYDSEEAEEQICPYDLSGSIEPLQEGTYTIKVVFVDKYVDRTEILHEKTVSFKVVPD